MKDEHTVQRHKLSEQQHQANTWVFEGVKAKRHPNVTAQLAKVKYRLLLAISKEQGS